MEGEGAEVLWGLVGVVMVNEVELCWCGRGVGDGSYVFQPCAYRLLTLSLVADLISAWSCRAQ